MQIVDSFRGAAHVAHSLRRNSLNKKPWQLRWKPVCASTERELTNWLKEKPLIGSIPRAFFAARQTHGTGQRGRIWQSPIGGVWISAALPITKDTKSSGLLGLAVAVALAQNLERFNVPVQIKWPNDLMVGERKLAGFLPRLIHRGEKLRLGRIGLGLNVCNRVPIGAISLAEILRPRNCQQGFWAVQVLLSLERSTELIANAEYLCFEAERLLWSKTFKDPLTGDIMQIEGLDDNGALKLRNGSYKKVLNRWD